MNELMVVRHVFEGADLESVVWKGRPCWVARHIGKLLGYNREGGRLAEMVSADPEYVRGRDYEVLSGDDLTAYRATFGHAPDSVGYQNRAQALIVLYETGVYMALQRTRKPIGVRLRRFIADDVMPQLVRTGRYEAEQTVPQGAQVAELERRVGGLEGAVTSIAQTLQGLTEAVTGMAQGIAQLAQAQQPRLLDQRTEHHHGPGGSLTVELTDGRVTVSAKSNCPPEYSIRGLTHLGAMLACSHQAIKRRLMQVDLLDDPDWSWVGQEPAYIGGRSRLVTAYRFKPGVLAELQRRETPLFAEPATA